MAQMTAQGTPHVFLELLADAAFVCIFLWYVFTVHLRCTCCEKLSHYVGIFFFPFSRFHSSHNPLPNPPSSFHYSTLTGQKETNNRKKRKAVLLFYFGAAVVTEHRSARSKKTHPKTCQKNPALQPQVEPIAERRSARRAQRPLRKSPSVSYSSPVTRPLSFITFIFQAKQ